MPESRLPEMTPPCELGHGPDADGSVRTSGGGFGVMAKPIGPKCNLDCRYCYYLEKERLYPSARGFRMSERLLEAFIRRYIEAQEGPEVWFNWQGGEPTLLGLGFFEKVVELERRYCPQGKTVHNALQTNGTLLDERWAAFFKAHGFLVGLSIDGPRRLHDRYRVGRQGRPTFDAVHRALGLLRDEGVEFNTLSVVHRANAKEGRRVYRFLRDEGVRFMQFIALVERIEADGSLAGPPSADDGRPGPAVAPWCAPAKGYGDFMCAVFDEWVRADVGNVFVQLFDVELELWSGLRSTLCVFAETCGRALALEHNGDLYACDHYVYPGFRLGNVGEAPLETLAGSAEQVRFGEAKRDALPRHCRKCEFLFACNGGCPKHRFARTPDGEPGLNYLCPSYKRYFAHTAPYMRVMAELLRSGRPPALITRMLRDQASGTPPRPAAKVGRNKPCPCGSGRKFKRCCGAFLEKSV